MVHFHFFKVSTHMSGKSYFLQLRFHGTLIILVPINWTHPKVFQTASIALFVWLKCLWLENWSYSSAKVFPNWKKWNHWTLLDFNFVEMFQPLLSISMSQNRTQILLTGVNVLILTWVKPKYGAILYNPTVFFKVQFWPLPT